MNHQFYFLFVLFIYQIIHYFALIYLKMLYELIYSKKNNPIETTKLTFKKIYAKINNERKLPRVEHNIHQPQCNYSPW